MRSRAGTAESSRKSKPRPIGPDTGQRVEYSNDSEAPPADRAGARVEGSASALSLSRPAQASLTLRPAGSLSRLRRPLSRGSGPSGYPAEPLVSYRSNRQLSGWNPPPQAIRAFGAHDPIRTGRAILRMTGNRSHSGIHVSAAAPARNLHRPGAPARARRGPLPPFREDGVAARLLR